MGQQDEKGKITKISNFFQLIINYITINDKDASKIRTVRSSEANFNKEMSSHFKAPTGVKPPREAYYIKAVEKDTGVESIMEKLTKG